MSELSTEQMERLSFIESQSAFRQSLVDNLTLENSDVTRVRVVDNNSGLLSFDAFSRAEVASPFTLADYIFKYDLLPLEMATFTATDGDINHLPNEACAQLLTTSSTNSRAVIQSKRYHRYQAGRAGKVMLTCTIPGSTSGVTYRWGFFDDKNGLFFQLKDGVFAVVTRSYVSGSALDTSVAQANFNHDKADGTGTSGFDLDFTKGNIFEIDFQWLGVGTVTFKTVKEDGSGVELHKIENPNSKTAVYMTTATLPIRYEVLTHDTSSGGELHAICSSVVSSGGSEPPEFLFTSGNTSAITTASSSETHLFSVRLKSTFNGIDNVMTILPKDIFIASDKGSCLFKAYLNPTLSGATASSDWTSVNDNSGMELNTTATFSSAGIPVLHFPFLSSSGSSATISRDFVSRSGLTKFSLNRDILNSNSDVLTFTVRRLTTTNVDAMASVQWGEIR